MAREIFYEIKKIGGKIEQLVETMGNSGKLKPEKADNSIVGKAGPAIE